MKFCSTGSVRTDRSFRTPITTRSTTEAPDVSSFDADTPGPSSASTSSAHDWMQSPMPFANEEGDNEVRFMIFNPLLSFAEFQALNRKRKKKKEETLTSYLNKYTSEDNASFEELAKVMREREDARRPWVYKAEEEHNKNLVRYSFTNKI